eukprot:jgi/Galph1/4776/GphlegSOOS_G3441.1
MRVSTTRDYNQSGLVYPSKLYPLKMNKMTTLKTNQPKKQSKKLKHKALEKKREGSKRHLCIDSASALKEKTNNGGPPDLSSSYINLKGSRKTTPRNNSSVNKSEHVAPLDADLEKSTSLVKRTKDIGDLEKTLDQSYKNESDMLQEWETAMPKKETSSYIEAESDHNQQQPSYPFPDLYVKAVRKHTLLSHAEEIELASYVKEYSRLTKTQERLMKKLGRKVSVEEWAVEAGMSVKDLQEAIIQGANAKERLVMSNLRLVHSIAFRYMRDSSSLGLIQAAERYDASFGFRFSTFATWWIRANILRYLNEQFRTVHVPTRVLALFNQSKKVASDLGKELQRAPTEREICSQLGISSSRLRFCIEAVSNQPVSLEGLGERPDKKKNDFTNGTTYCVAWSSENTEESLCEDLLRADLLKIMKEFLTPMELKALLLRFGLRDGRYRSLEECGSIMSCSRERVRQLLLNGITKLKNSAVERVLKDYL